MAFQVENHFELQEIRNAAPKRLKSSPPTNTPKNADDEKLNRLSES